VVGFPGTYHAILGRPTYVKFMAVPNYTYLKQVEDSWSEGDHHGGDYVPAHIRM
jgi:hypothetical protein